MIPLFFFLKNAFFFAIAFWLAGVGVPVCLLSRSLWRRVSVRSCWGASSGPDAWARCLSVPCRRRCLRLVVVVLGHGHVSF